MKPHFVRDYNRFVRRLVATEQDYEVAMAVAVGGQYAEVGSVERRILESLGLQSQHYVIDVGAGSGRLASALSDLPDLRYLGTDVVPDLLDFARKKCARADWTFKQIDRIEIPETGGVADFVVFFSVFTHLREQESYRYLQEAKRVLRQNGTIVVSYLDRNVAYHVQVAGDWWTRLKLWIMGRRVRNQLLSKPVLENWAKQLDLSIEYCQGAQIGQSVCAYRMAKDVR